MKPLGNHRDKNLEKFQDPDRALAKKSGQIIGKPQR